MITLELNGLYAVVLSKNHMYSYTLYELLNCGMLYRFQGIASDINEIKNLMRDL